MNNKVSYFFAKLKSRLHKDKREYMSSFFRKKGIKVGNHCNITANILTTESFLISIGDDVTVSEDVLFITHDASVGKIMGKENVSDLFGPINIGNNCFIGARATVLYGVTLADNIIVAAGSVVTKSFDEQGIIIGGVPARKIGTWEGMREKAEKYGFSLHRKSSNIRKKTVGDHPEKWIIR